MADKNASETLGQAQKWETVKSKYLAAGLCHACACQAAWGHQLGFGYRADRPWDEDDRRIKPPCDDCAPIVNTFPVQGPAGSPWRHFRKGSRGE